MFLLMETRSSLYVWAPRSPWVNKVGCWTWVSWLEYNESGLIGLADYIKSIDPFRRWLRGHSSI